jgi:hypothetical protein
MAVNSSSEESGNATAVREDWEDLVQTEIIYPGAGGGRAGAGGDRRPPLTNNPRETVAERAAPPTDSLWKNVCFLR